MRRRRVLAVHARYNNSNNNIIVYIHGAQANSAFHPSGVDRPIIEQQLKIVSRCRRTAAATDVY